MNSKYLTYSPNELALDNTFIQWVQSGKPADSPWAIWLLDNPEIDTIVNEAITIVSSFQYSEKSIPEGKTDELWSRINNTLAEEIDTKVILMPRRKVFRMVAYAAVACLALFFSSRLFFDSNESVYVGNGKSIAHVLPDESRVRLNADSKIIYNKASWSKDRSISLEGEGYFEVEKGQKFTVQTDHGEIAVLGTSFNIYSRPDGFNVHCTSGRVQVTAGKDKVILTPGTLTSLNNGTLTRTEITQNKEVDWLNKIYRFDTLPLKVVFDAIERQFDVDIISDQNVTDRLYTGSFEATDLNKALNTICFPMELTSTIQGRTIRIYPDEGN